MYCQFCHSEKIANQFKVHSSITHETVIYYQCHHCGSFYQFPLPDLKKLVQYYESYADIKSKMNPGYLEQQQLTGLFAERDMTLAEIGFDKAQITSKNCVEVGCANGHFLHYLKANQAKPLIGIDISASLLEMINIPEATLIEGDLSAISADNIDCLFMFNILEHMTNIDSTMELIQSRLKREGYLIIEIPLAGFVSRYFKANWRFFMPDEHLHLPSLKGLKILLNRYQMKITGATRFGSGFTTGMIHRILKKGLDKLAKRWHFGDRGAFLIRFKD
ncbi:MAG: class I SAM-dependent methyltransferase [Spirochaetes bacterium]|nr:class I SAM-dependent methyltransferase [Spirochaetota bacterium]